MIVCDIYHIVYYIFIISSYNLNIFIFHIIKFLMIYMYIYSDIFISLYSDIFTSLYTILAYNNSDDTIYLVLYIVLYI